MFRRYNATQGRWISPDPAGVAAANPADPQTWNRYAYVGNRPLNSSDPLGLFDLPCDWGCWDPFPPCDPEFGCFPGPIFPPILPGPPGGGPPGGGPPGGGGPPPQRTGGVWPGNRTPGLPGGLGKFPFNLGDLLGLSPGTQCGDFVACDVLGGTPNPFGSLSFTGATTIGTIAAGAVEAIDAIATGVFGLLLAQTGDNDPCATHPDFSNCDKWQCTASCNLQGIGGVNPPYPRVTGRGSGSTETLACANAKQAATQSAPRGTYGRHCQCDCSKQ
jgi:hypothetical protein